MGAVLAVLGQEFPGVSLTGVDIEPKQLEYARGHLERSGVEATLLQADALELPFEDESFDHVWMMWFLEHVADPPAVLREARRVLVPGGAITAIEVDYSTVPRRAVHARTRGAVPRDGRGHGRIRLERRRHTAAGLAPRGGLPRGRRGRAAVLVAGRGSGRPGELRGRRDRERARASSPAPTRRSCAPAWRTCGTSRATPAQASAGPCTSRRPFASAGAPRATTRS